MIIGGLKFINSEITVFLEDTNLSANRVRHLEIAAYLRCASIVKMHDCFCSFSVAGWNTFACLVEVFNFLVNAFSKNFIRSMGQKDNQPREK